MGEKDITQKNFEAYNDVFADIINGCLFDGEEVISENSLMDAQTYSQYKADDSAIHEQERDVAKYWLDKKCCLRLALIGVENQLAIDTDMPLRIMGYDGSAYRDEMNQDELQTCQITGQKRRVKNKRYPIITLVLYFGKTPWKKPLCLYDALDIPPRLRAFVSDYKINVIDVPRLTDKQVGKFVSDFRIIADYFVQICNKKEYQPNKQKIRHADGLLKLKSVLTNDKRYMEVYSTDLDKMEGLDMCEVLDRVESRGESRGREIGKEIGKKYGIETINKLYALLLAKGLNDDVTKAIRDKTYCDYLLNKYRSALV